MSRHIRLHGRPMWAIGSSPPPLQLVGTLPNYTPSENYEGRLDILNNIGPCGVEILWDESFLPEGAAAEVDMDNLQVVVTWPAYTPPEEVKTSIVNGDFQSGSMEGWHDLRGSYSVKKYEDDDTNVGPGDRPRPSGNMAAWMEGFGRGDHILESARYPVQQGQSIMARSLWDQGPSNKDNNNLFTAFGLWNNDSFLGQVLGDRIHDRTNKTRHWSTVNHVVGIHETHITVRLIAHRRNGRNRPIIVDNVETSGLTYSVGQNTPDDEYYLCLRLWDSAGRIANWCGDILLGGAVSCSVESSYQGGNDFPSEFNVSLGSGTGLVVLEFVTASNPDKFEVWLGGNKVLDTGYYGDPARQSALDAFMVANGLPTEQINRAKRLNDPNLTIQEMFDDPTNRDFASFIKSTAHPTATVKVFGPLDDTLWVCKLNCPAVPPEGSHQVFTENGTFIPPAGVESVDVIVVGGGGGGGSRQGGGGGGGGVTVSTIKVIPELVIPVVVGAGGAGGASGGSGENGESSYFGDVVGEGGGGGGGRSFSPIGKIGGSGGGGAAPNDIGSASGGAGAPGQGNSGGAGRTVSLAHNSPAGGGGGGAGGPGDDVSESAPVNGGDGGPGVYFPEFNDYGDGGYFAGGGGGGGGSATSPEAQAGGQGGVGGGGKGSFAHPSTASEVPPDPGSPNTGGGGGASGRDTFQGGDGGSGVVIVSWPGGKIPPTVTAPRAITVIP